MIGVNNEVNPWIYHLVNLCGFLFHLEVVFWKKN